MYYQTLSISDFCIAMLLLLSQVVLDRRKILLLVRFNIALIRVTLLYK